MYNATLLKTLLQKKTLKTNEAETSTSKLHYIVYIFIQSWFMSWPTTWSTKGIKTIQHGFWVCINYSPNGSNCSSSTVNRVLELAVGNNNTSTLFVCDVTAIVETASFSVWKVSRPSVNRVPSLKMKSAPDKSSSTMVSWIRCPTEAKICQIHNLPWGNLIESSTMSACRVWTKSSVMLIVDWPLQTSVGVMELVVNQSIININLIVTQKISNRFGNWFNRDYSWINQDSGWIQRDAIKNPDDILMNSLNKFGFQCDKENTCFGNM